MPLIEDPVHEYFTNHLDNLMVKHIYLHFYPDIHIYAYLGKIYCF